MDFGVAWSQIQGVDVMLCSVDVGVCEACATRFSGLRKAWRDGSEKLRLQVKQILRFIIIESTYIYIESEKPRDNATPDEAN